jgi:hypothetical protein
MSGGCCSIGDRCRCVSERSLCPNWQTPEGLTGAAVLSDDELLRLWHEAGGGFNGPYVEGGWVRSYMDKAKLLSFLRSFAASIRVEGIEAAARWHDEKAAHHRYIAASTRENWTGSDIGEDDLRDNLRYARENDADAALHENHAKAIRRELAPAPQAQDAG